MTAVEISGSGAGQEENSGRQVRKLRPSERTVFHHAHIDAQAELSDLALERLQALGFKLDNFSGAPEGSSTLVPQAHLTKLYGADQVQQKDIDLQAAGSVLDELKVPSYTEGEVISSEYRGEAQKNLDGPVEPFPCRFVQAPLSGNAGDTFKQSELHIEMHESSNVNLINELIRAGFMPICWEDEVILTAQGNRRAIAALEALVVDYIEKQGGAKRLHIIRESMSSHSFHGGFQHTELPDVIVGLVEVC